MKNREEREDVSKYIKKMTWGASVVFVGRFLSKLLGYFYILIAARLGAENYGMLNIGLSVVSLLAIFSFLGLENAAFRYIPYFEVKKDKASIRGILFLCIKVGLILATLFTLLLSSFSRQIAVLFFHNAELTPILRIFSFTILPLSFMTFFATIFSSFQKVDYEIGVREIGEKLFRGLLTLLLVYLGFGVIGASVSYLFSSFLMLLVCLYLMQKKVFSIFKTNQKVKYHNKELLLYSFPLLFSTLLNSSIYSISTLFLGYFRTASEVGIYNVALPTASLVVTVPFAITALFIPIMTKLFTRKKTDLIKQIYKTVNRWIFFANFPLFLIILLFPRQILRILFGQIYDGGWIALSILSFGYLLYSLSYASAAMLLVIRKTKIVFLITLVFALTNISLNIFLIPHYGFNGAAIATTFSYLVISFLSSFFTYKYTKLQPFKSSNLKIFFVAVISMLIVQIARLIFKLTALYLFILTLFIFGVLYFVLLSLFKCFEKEDIEILQVILRRLKYKGNLKER